MAFWQGAFDNNFQLYRGQRVDVRLSYWASVGTPISFKEPSSGIVDIWSDGRCYSPATDSYIRPINTINSKSRGFPS
jgi:hypothetical protein